MRKSININNKMSDPKIFESKTVSVWDGFGRLICNVDAGTAGKMIESPFYFAITTQDINLRRKT